MIDEGETAERTAVRELEEETGFKADRVIESTPLLATDPGNSQYLINLHVLLISHLMLLILSFGIYRHDERKHEASHSSRHFSR